MIDDPPVQSKSDPTTSPEFVETWPVTPAGRRFYKATILILLAPLVVDWPFSVLGRLFEDYKSVLSAVAGIVVTKFCLISTWLAWGGLRAVWRMMIVMAGVTFSGAVLAIHPNDRGFTSIYLLVMISLSGLLAIPRLFGVRWIVLSDGNEPDLSNRKGQFSIVDMLIWTVAAAVLATVIRWHGFPRDLDDGGMLVAVVIGAAAYTVLPAIAVLAAMWAVLPLEANHILRIVIAFIVALGEGFFVFLLIVGSGPPASELFIVIVGLFGTATFWLTLTFGVLRYFGHRLIRERRSLEQFRRPSIESIPEDQARG